MNPRKKLPLGIQTFSKIRSDNYYYIDKTDLIMDLWEDSTHYFLSRPRRFGKSLLIDTLKELFEGNQNLFKGLAAEEAWDWSVSYPVLRFSFAGNNYAQAGYLERDLLEQLDSFAQQYGFKEEGLTVGGYFKALLLHLEQQTGQPTVVLIDEYDKPILDTIAMPDIARANRDFLCGFYGAIKDYDAHIKFSFLTGVSKFSKVSLFSGLSNLKDISLDSRFATICGYTDEDINTVFAPELPGLDRAQIREWYNGYSWLGISVYNPFDVLRLFDERKFQNYWFETGAPILLVDVLLKHRIATPKLNNMLSSSQVLSSFDVEKITPEALLFQTGYLTIKEEKALGSQWFYRLGYPNLEVYQSLNESLLGALTQGHQQSEHSAQLYELLLENDFDGLKALFQRFFSTIPYQCYTHSDMQQYEGYYASVFYSYFASLGLDITLEDVTNLGCIDMTLKFNNQVYILEFKVVEMVPEGQALRQIRERGYADKYRGMQQPIYLIGVEFSRESRNIAGFEVERA